MPQQEIIVLSPEDVRTMKRMSRWFRRPPRPFTSGPFGPTLNQPSPRRGGGVADTAELPTPQYQFMVYQGVAANTAGFDYVRAHLTV